MRRRRKAFLLIGLFFVIMGVSAYLYVWDGTTFWQNISGIVGRQKVRKMGKAIPTPKRPEKTKLEEENIPFYEPRPSNVFSWVAREPKPPSVYTYKPEGYIAELDGIGGTVEKIKGDVITLVNPEITNSNDRAARSARWRVRIDSPAVKVFKFTGDFSSGQPWSDSSLADLVPGARVGFIWVRPQGGIASFILYEIDIGPEKE